MSRERKPFTDVSGKANDVRRMSKAAEMAALLEKHRGERHAIVMRITRTLTPSLRRGRTR